MSRRAVEVLDEYGTAVELRFARMSSGTVHVVEPSPPNWARQDHRTLSGWSEAAGAVAAGTRMVCGLRRFVDPTETGRAAYVSVFPDGDLCARCVKGLGEHSPRAFEHPQPGDSEEVNVTLEQENTTMNTTPDAIIRRAVQVEFAVRIRHLVEERDGSPAVHGPMGDMEPAWVQRESEALHDVVNGLRAGLGKGDVAIEEIRRVEYDVAVRPTSTDYAEGYAQSLAELVFSD